VAAKQRAQAAAANAPAENLYTMSQAAQLKGVSYHTVSRAIRRGALPAERIGKMAFISRGDLQAWHPKYDRAPMQYRHRTPTADVQHVMIDLAATERVQLATQLSALIELAESSVREAEIERTLRIVCERLASVLNLSRVQLWRIDRGQTGAALLASNSALPETGSIALDEHARFATLVGQCRGGAVVDAEGMPVLAGAAKALIVPLALGDRLLGFVAADRDDDALDLGSSEFQFATAAVNHACLALALQEARLSALSNVQPKKTPLRSAVSA
jgi:excisionase family DNA binding protein